MENIIVAASNLYGLRVLRKSFTKKKYLHAFVITGAIGSSIFYHLFETHKHSMPGFSIYKSIYWHNILINIDRLFAISLVLMMFNYNKIIKNMFVICIALLCLGISEMDQLWTYKHHKYVYMFFHILWHFLAFHLAYLFL